MYEFVIKLSGEQSFSEKDMVNLINQNILDATTCIRSADGTVIVNSKATVELRKITDKVISPFNFAI